MKPVTARQRDVLREIRSYQRTHGYSPSQRELGAILGMTSTSTVSSHLATLVLKGCLQRIERTSRALVITDAGHAVLNGTSEEVRT